jgi:hypothetical protein
MGKKEKLPWLFDCIQRIILQHRGDPKESSENRESFETAFHVKLDSETKSSWRKIAQQLDFPGANSFLQWLDISSEETLLGCGYLPDFAVDDAQDPIGKIDCWFWMPNGYQPLPTLGIVSSHLGRDWTRHPDRLDAIRTAVARAATDAMQIITGENTTTDNLVRRAACWFDVPYIAVQRLKISTNPNQTCQLTEVRNKVSQFPLFVWPASPQTNQRQSWLDAIVIQSATRVICISVKSGGNIQAQLHQRLQGDDSRLKENDSGNRVTLLYQKDRATSAEQNLFDVGAIPWMLIPSDDSNFSQTAPKKSKTLVTELAYDQIDWSQWLVHLTRAQPMAWPDETDAMFLDGLLFGEHSRDCLATLMRIVAQGRLHAGQDMIRGHFPMVCFSEVQPKGLVQQRTFRSHLNRWDYEPFGIAIRKSIIQKLSGRPVIYGDQCTWNVLKENEKPYFQNKTSETKAGAIDWANEKEWRVFGDIDMRNIPISDVIIVVDTTENAERLAPLSRWPIVAISG